MKSQPKLEKYWDQFVEGYAQLQKCSNVFGLTILNMLRIQDAESILDAGCGLGYLLPYMISKKQPKTRIQSVDISQQMVQTTNALIKQFLLGRNCELDGITEEDIVDGNTNESIQLFQSVGWNNKQCDVEDLSQFKDGEFDRYYSNMVLHLTGNPQQGLKEAYRVLRKGGQIGIIVWGHKEKSDQFTLIRDALVEAGAILPKLHDQFALGNKEQMKTLLESIGFSDLLLWYQMGPYDKYSVDDIMKTINPANQEILNQQSDVIQHKFYEILKQKIDNKMNVLHEPLMLECLMIFGKKQ